VERSTRALAGAAEVLVSQQKRRAGMGRVSDRMTLRVDHALSLSAVVFEIARALVKVLCGCPCHRVCVTIHRLVCGSGEQQDE